MSAGALNCPAATWEFGANEGPTRWPLVSVDAKMTRAYTGSEATMLAWSINGGYTRYRCVTVPAFNASAAEQQVSHEQNEPYWVPSPGIRQSQAYNVLRDTGEPNDGVSNALPNNWFNGLSSASFGDPFTLKHRSQLEASGRISLRPEAWRRPH